MLKWIKARKSNKRENKSSNYLGVRLQNKKFEAYILLSKKNNSGESKQFRFIIGYYTTEKQAAIARVEYILSLI